MILDKLKQGVERRLEQKIDNWAPTQGDHAKRVKLLETGYFFAGFILVLAGLSLPGGGYSSLLVIFLIVAGLSKPVREPAIQAIYSTVGQSFGWPTWQAGWEMDKRQLEAHRTSMEAEIAAGTRRPSFVETFLGARKPKSGASSVPAPTQPSPSVKSTPQAPNPRITEALRLWAASASDERRNLAEPTASFLQGLLPNDPRFALMADAAEADRPILANSILTTFAKQQGFALMEGLSQ